MSKDFPVQFFGRQDESPDEEFYLHPRFKTHIDDATIYNLTNYYRENIPKNGRVLDLMSSWISHLPADQSYRTVSGIGMNREELAANKRLNDYHVRNLNTDPTVPYLSESFDAVLIAVSVQYLIHPLEVFKDIARCLLPAGKCIVSMSHRLFPSKAILAFHTLPPEDRCQLVASYMNQTGFVNIKTVDRSPKHADPLWIVTGEK